MNFIFILVLLCIIKQRESHWLIRFHKVENVVKMLASFPCSSGTEKLWNDEGKILELPMPTDLKKNKLKMDDTTHILNLEDVIKMARSSLGVGYQKHKPGVQS